MMSRWSFPWCVVTPTVFNSDLSLVGKLGADNARCLGVLSIQSWRLARLFVSEASLACTTSWIMCRFLLDRPNLTLDRSLV
ncbi:hypothetical protein MCOR19_005460 [Pyricularia oryzae]|nr:hypothetical protein MCOR19_005460 [Pyricularia oryzae]KAI6482128.1 hypothetical protein MCOR13_010603 [Pyricularia oryzae]